MSSLHQVLNCKVLYIYYYYHLSVVIYVSVCVNSSSTKTADANVPESYHSKSDDEDEEILGSDDDEQEDPQDYCKGASCHKWTLYIESSLRIISVNIICVNHLSVQIFFQLCFLHSILRCIPAVFHEASIIWQNGCVFVE